MFELLTQLFLKDREDQRKQNAFYIENGFCESWSDDYKTPSDNGIQRYSTDLRWKQYTEGTITREKAVELATKRMDRQIDKDIERGLARLDAVAGAPDLTSATVDIEWRRSSVWGNNPYTDTWTDGGRFAGYASGCGYDKGSASVADAFNRDNTMLKVLYTLKERGLADGQTDTDTTACTGHDNRKIIGYGAGYSALPYYEGGVGLECFWSILRKAGFEVDCYYGKREDHFRISRATA